MLENVVKNVDLSCCGVAFRPGRLNEYYPNAIQHCLTHCYEISPSAQMCTERIFARISKLEDRGWKKLRDDIEICEKLINRNLYK